jgi:hypothetical protein
MAATGHFFVGFREHWRALQRGRPGRRFQERYERARKGKAQHGGAARRIVTIVLSIVCLAIGLVLTVMPGPAVVFFFLAGGLLATESRAVARFMDWAEVHLRQVWAWAKRRWRRLPRAARVALLVAAACFAVAAMYVGYRFLRG